MPGQEGAGRAEFLDDVFVCHEAEFYALAGGSSSVQLAVSKREAGRKRMLPASPVSNLRAECSGL
jgi:hypothetical protein